MRIRLHVVFLDMRGEAGPVECSLTHLHGQLAVMDRNEEALDDCFDDGCFPVGERVESHYVDIGPGFLTLKDRRDLGEIEDRLVSDLVAVIARPLRYELFTFVAWELLKPPQ